MVFLVCDKMSQERFCSHWREDCVDVKEFTRETSFLVGRLVVFQAQREQWVSNNHRTTVEGHSQLQCKACQSIQLIVEKTFQVELVDMNWKKKWSEVPYCPSDQGIKFCSKIKSARNHFKSNERVGLIVVNPTQFISSQTDVRSERYCDLFESSNRQKKGRWLCSPYRLTW